MRLLQFFMASFSLFSTIKFPTRNFVNSHTFIDNIFIDINRFNFSTKPLINGLSDHDAQIIALSDIMCSTPRQFPSYVMTIDSNCTGRFSELLSYENWEAVFQDIDVNQIFNSFQSTYLRIFHSCFPIRKNLKLLNLNRGLQPVLGSAAPIKENYF